MPLRALILHNFWLKFSSVALATVIWMAIHYNIEHDFALRESDVKHLVAQKYLDVSVSIVTAPDDNRRFSVVPSHVEVVALGEEALLRSISRNNIRVHVDLSDLRQRKASDVELQADVPRELTVIAINPPTVTVEQISP